MSALAPPRGELVDAVAHGHRHAHRTLHRVGHDDRIVEEDHHPVAREALEGALAGEHQRAHPCVILAQHAHHLLGLGPLGERGEAAQVDEDDGHLPAV